MAIQDKIWTEGDAIPAVFNISFFDNLNDSTDGDCDEDERQKVANWLNGLGLGRYSAALGEEGFDHFSIIQDLDEDDINQLIKDCKMPRLHARQFRRALERVMAERFGAETTNDSMQIASAECLEANIGAETDIAVREVALAKDETGKKEDLGAVPYRFSDQIFEAEAVLTDLEKWSCPKCDASNRLTRERCKNCGAAKSKPQKWACPKYDEGKKDADEKAVRVKKTTMNQNTKCTKQHEKNQRKKANKKLAKEKEDQDFINQTKDLSSVAV